jgi:hypothetical protein
MPPTSAGRAGARSPHARAQPRRMPHPRRVSGPIARSVPAVTLPAPRHGSTGAFERLRALPDHRMVDRLLRGRAWIWLIGLMLGGIVAMQVSLLKLNAGISQSVERASTLERVNADLETDVARLSSGERIQQAAAAEGMVAPPAGDVGFLRARPEIDPRLAAERMQSPSDEASRLMANGGHAPVVLAPAPVDPVVPEALAPVPPAPTATPQPIGTPAPTPAPLQPAAGTTAPTG